MPVEKQGDELDDFEPDPAEPKPAEPTPKKPAEEPAKPVHSARLLKLAEAVGITAAEANGMSRADLTAEIEHANKVIELERSVASVDAGRRQQAPAAVPEVQAAPKQKSLAEEFGVELDDEIEEDDGQGGVRKRKVEEKDFAPAIVKIFRKLNGELAALKEKNETLSKSEQARQVALQDQLIETSFAGLGKAFEKLLGAGTHAEIEKPQMAKRIAVLRHAGIDWQKDAAKAIGEKIAAAAAELFGDLATPEEEEGAAPQGSAYAGKGPLEDEPAKPKAKAKTGKTDEWQRSHVARPTARNGSAEPKGTKTAVKAVADKMRAAGVDPGPISESSEEDDFV